MFVKFHSDCLRFDIKISFRDNLKAKKKNLTHTLFEVYFKIEQKHGPCLVKKIINKLKGLSEMPPILTCI